MKCLPLSGFGKWTFPLSVTQAAKPLKFFLLCLNLPSLGSHPRPSVSVAVGSVVATLGDVVLREGGTQLHGAFYFCLKVSSFHFRLTLSPTAQGCVASHTNVWAIKAPVFFWCVLVGAAAGARDFCKGMSISSSCCYAPALLKRVYGIAFETYCTDETQPVVSLSLLSNTDCAFPAADCQDEIPK